jgi:hypothetical protein
LGRSVPGAVYVTKSCTVYLPRGKGGGLGDGDGLGEGLGLGDGLGDGLGLGEGDGIRTFVLSIERAAMGRGLGEANGIGTLVTIIIFVLSLNGVPQYEKLLPPFPPFILTELPDALKSCTFRPGGTLT